MVLRNWSFYTASCSRRRNSKRKRKEKKAEITGVGRRYAPCRRTYLFGNTRVETDHVSLWCALKKLRLWNFLGHAILSQKLCSANLSGRQRKQRTQSLICTFQRKTSFCFCWCRIFVCFFLKKSKMKWLWTMIWKGCQQSLGNRGKPLRGACNSAKQK